MTGVETLRKYTPTSTRNLQYTLRFVEGLGFGAEGFVC